MKFRFGKYHARITLGRDAKYERRVERGVALFIGWSPTAKYEVAAVGGVSEINAKMCFKVAKFYVDLEAAWGDP